MITDEMKQEIIKRISEPLSTDVIEETAEIERLNQISWWEEALLMTGAWGVSSAGGYPHTINWFEWWDIENDDGDDVAIIFESEKCPHIYHDDDEDGFEEEFCDLNDESCPGSCGVWEAIQKRIRQEVKDERD